MSRRIQDEFSHLPKWKRQALRAKRDGKWHQATCEDCGAPKFATFPGKTGVCYACWRRRAALKKLPPEDSPDYAQKVVEIFNADLSHKKPKPRDSPANPPRQLR